MKHYRVNSYYNVYRLVTETKKPLCVAVPKSFEAQIEAAVKAYGSIQKVPADRTVRGIFMECRHHNYNFDPEQQENDVLMNQLRPYPYD